MITEKIYNDLLLFCNIMNIQLILIGDSQQLPAVNNNNNNNKNNNNNNNLCQEPYVYFINKKNNKKNNSITLTKVVRNNGNIELLKLYNLFRKNIIKKEDNKKKLIILKTKLRKKHKDKLFSKNTFENKIIKKAKENKNDFMVIAYSNKKVEYYNNLVIKALYPNSSEKYNIGQKIIFCENFDPSLISVFGQNNFIDLQKDEYSNSDEKQTIYKGTEFIIKNILTKKYLSSYYNVFFKCYELSISKVNNNNNNNFYKILKIHPDDNDKFEKYKLNKKKEIEKNIRKFRKTEKEINKLWDSYFNENIKLNVNIKNSYAITTYSSQGSTYKNVFLDYMNIVNSLAFYNKYDLLYKALYTSVSRTSENISLYLY